MTIRVVCSRIGARVKRLAEPLVSEYLPYRQALERILLQDASDEIPRFCTEFQQYEFERTNIEILPSLSQSGRS